MSRRVRAAVAATLSAYLLSAPVHSSQLDEARLIHPARRPASSALADDTVRAILRAASCKAVLGDDSIGQFGGCAFAWSSLLRENVDATQLAEAVTRLDACVPSNAAWAEVRQPASVAGIIHEPELARSSRRSPAEERVREQLVADFEQLKGFTASFCCGSDETCRERILSTRLGWCQAPTNASSSAPCANGGAYTLMTDASWSTWQNTRSAALDKAADGPAVRRQLPELTYEVFVSRRFHPESGLSFTGYRVLAHELGHVCTDQRRMSAVRAGDASAFALASDLGDSRTPKGDTPRCRTQAPHEAFYRDLATSLGMSTETLSCLSGMTRGANRLRFGQGDCPWGCSNDHWEEAFADWTHFHTVPEDHWVPELVPGFCNFKRDGQHGLPADELECFLRTPEFRKRYAAVVGCQGPPG